jgi:cation:H+ antiporter
MTTLLLLIAGFVGLVAGGDLLVRGAARMAAAFGIAPLVVGLTVVAFGTSAPELAVGVAAGASGASDVALGNVVGSNICNVLLILGLSALVAPLTVQRQLVRQDVPVMIVVSCLVLLLGLDGRIGRLDGVVLAAGVVLYTVVLLVQARRSPATDLDGNAPEASPAARGSGWRARVLDVLLIAVGIGMLVVGARWLVEGASAVARAMQVSELVIGLTVVALGTSLPELATSIVAALRGERDIAVGNVVGSNLFNLLAVLGLSSAVLPGGIPVGAVALRFDLPVMIAVAVACLPIFFTGYTVARWEGALFLGYYAAYVTLLLLEGTHAGAAGWLKLSVGGFLVPLTAVTLAVLAWRARRAGWR